MHTLSVATTGDALHVGLSNMLNGLDLFSGIGGLSIALKPWVHTVAYCERDAYAQAVLLSRMASNELDRAPIWDDVTSLRGSMLPRVDIVFGGFPCQDISVAGRGKGLAGERSGLYWQTHRLIRECRPSFVFLENVPAIRTRGAREVAESLTDLGYDQRWSVISAKEIGASFIGRRWFLLAATDSEALRVEQGRSGGAYRENAALDMAVSDIRLTPWTPERGFEPRIFGTGDGVPSAVDRDRCLGNAVVPLQAREAFTRLAGIESFSKGVGA